MKKEHKKKGKRNEKTKAVSHEGVRPSVRTQGGQPPHPTQFMGFADIN
jgi:hypothetical protein